MAAAAGSRSAFDSETFSKTVSIAVDDEIGSASISPSGRDVVLASQSGLRIIDLDNPYSLPLYIPNHFSWKVADVQWSPFAARAEWIASTRNQQALVYNLSMPFNNKKAPIEFTLRAHDRAITDINFSAHHPDLLATCGMDSYVFVHDLRSQQAPLKLADWEAGAHQVKWNRQDDKIIASSHDKYLHIWDIRHGTKPMSTIAAHSTKIYGIDWNRNDARKIMTCSLDQTIKLWNNVGVNTNNTEPRRTITTDYPVWRARHTPFPHGILAMPQRGSPSLFLYKHVNDSDAKTFEPKSVHEFQGHEPNTQVREFLWRSRGSTDNGVDNRDFQLVTWGTDNHLRLHHITPELLESTVGYRKGEALLEKPSTTRAGAVYVSYRDGPVQTTTATMQNEFGPPRSQQKGNLTTLLQNYSFTDDSYMPNRKQQKHMSTPVDMFPRETMTATPIRRNDPRVVTQITWMEGIKVGDGHDNSEDMRKRTSQDDHKEDSPYRKQHDLNAEISYVGNKYKKLNFETIDGPNRCITVSFNGPWGEFDPTTEDNKLVFLRFTIRFPQDYPRVIDKTQEGGDWSRTGKPLQIDFERTTAAISREDQEDLTEDMDRIALTCAIQRREALEAVLSYALGERGLHDSLHLEDDQPMEDFGPLPGEESSSDEDDDIPHEGEFTTDVMQSSHTNANIPLPNQCSVRFSAFGSLVVARIPTIKSAPALGAIFRIDRSLRHGPGKDEIFDSFGRFTAHPAHDSDDGSSQASSVGSWEASSSPSSDSDSDQVANAHIGNFQPPLAWQKAASRFQSRNSLPSSSGAAKPAPKPKSLVSIVSLAVDEFVPSKRSLAKEYRIFGSGPDICEHNSAIARRYGYDDLADIWLLCKLILSNEVPLEILPQQHRREQVLVLARRALVRIKRKDSGLDLQFDEADTVTNPKLTGRIKWGNHAVVTWLIPALFEHFERLADTQMLAMLSCVFAEPAAREGVSSTMAKMRHSHLPMSMEAPAFSLDYFSSTDAAWSLFKPTLSISSRPAHSRHATPVNDFGWQKSTKNVDVYGSHGSSNGPWGSDTIPSEPVTPYSTGHTPPPIVSRTSTIRNAHTTTYTPYSTSPEQTHSTLKKSSTANFASAVAALSRPFANAISSSPPVKSRTDDLSTSAPTSGVTWGTTTFYGSDNFDRRSLAPSRGKHSKRSSFGYTGSTNVDYMYDSDSEYERIDEEDGITNKGTLEYTRPITPGSDGGNSQGAIKLKLKNQDQFDDEACVSRPLLDMRKDWLYRAWREQYAELLGCWGLVSARAEVLKFNGLVSYFPPEVAWNLPKTETSYLSIKKGSEVGSTAPASTRLSRASTALVPPSINGGQAKRTPVASMRNFSFNPEAQEFQPGTVPFAPAETLALPPDAFISSEQYLQLSIPTPTPSKELDESLGGLGASPGQDKLHPRGSRQARPSLSRGTSNVSGSSWGIGRSPSAVATTPAVKPAEPEPIYSCSICWIRVCGRVYLCPACLHVAHFDCMNDELGMDDGECVVGCGCGCGFEDDDERTRMEAYIEEVRAANAAGVAWNESGGWLQLASTSEPATPGLYAEGMYGDSMTGPLSKPGAIQDDKRRERERGRVSGRASKTTSPTPTTSTMRKRKKEKKKPRASGLSYY
jgi:WD40 repeat protein